jgi:hypothetical protein
MSINKPDLPFSDDIHGNERNEQQQQRKESDFYDAIKKNKVAS